MSKQISQRQILTKLNHVELIENEVTDRKHGLAALARRLDDQKLVLQRIDLGVIATYRCIRQPDSCPGR